MCHSTVGFNRGKEKFLQLDPKICKAKDIYNGLLRIAGLLNEHQRKDRDSYVEIHYDNIRGGNDNKNFKQLRRTDTMNLPYNHKSLMHYTSNSFSSNGQPTITSKVCFDTCLQEFFAWVLGILFI